MLVSWTGVVAACSTPEPQTPVETSQVFADDSDRWIVGALHVHSTYTDGAGSVAEISEAAGEAGLDFFVLTDHWSLDALVEGEEGYGDGVLMLVGVEATTSVGHVLGFDLPVSPLRFGRRSAEEVLGQIRELGGFAIVAHPDGGRDSFTWTGWDLAGYQGIEIFNGYSTYMRKGLLRSLAYFLIDPRLQTELVDWSVDWNRELVATWDRMLAARKLSAWGGLDSHGGVRVTDDGFLPWPSYAMVFRMGRNHLLLDAPLTGSITADRESIFDALRAGRGYVELGDEFDGSRFRFWAEADGQLWPIGSDVEFDPDASGVSLHVVTDVPDVEVRLYRDGVQVDRTTTGELTFGVTEPGVYRVEADVRVSRLMGSFLQPWIITNPISILPGDRIQARIEAGLLPPTEGYDVDAAVPYALLLEPQMRGGCSRMDLTTDSGSGAYRAHFSLRVPGPGVADTVLEPYARCVAMDSRDHDLTGYRAIHFEVRADAIHRVNVVLTAGDGNLLTDGPAWTASFLAYEDWRWVTLPLDQFEGIRNRDGFLDDLSGITGVGFLFDTTNTRPGTSGEVEVRNVSLVPASP